MRLLTVHQPYAWLICAGHKKYENRDWTTTYRGTLLIHAGMSRDSLQRGRELCTSLNIALPDRLDFGAVIGQAVIFNCTPVDGIDDHFARGPKCFHLRSPILFEQPIPWRGALGLIEPSRELICSLPVPPGECWAEPFA